MVRWDCTPLFVVGLVEWWWDCHAPAGGRTRGGGGREIRVSVHQSGGHSWSGCSMEKRMASFHFARVWLLCREVVSIVRCTWYGDNVVNKLDIFQRRLIFGMLVCRSPKSVCTAHTVPQPPPKKNGAHICTTRSTSWHTPSPFCASCAIVGVQCALCKEYAVLDPVSSMLPWSLSHCCCLAKCGDTFS